jgi:hypothetical protein
MAALATDHCSLITRKEPAMNDDIEVAERVQKAILLPAENQIEWEWANALDCGALGPSREEAELFYQDAEDWEVSA